VVVGGVQVLHVKLVLTEASDPAQVRATVAACARRGWPVAMHAMGLVEVDTALDVLEAVPPPPGTRHRIEHLSLSLDDQVRRLARLPVTVVTNPGFLGSRGAKYAQELSPDEQGWLYRVRSLLDAGIRVRAGSDAPVTDPDPLAAARCAVLRGDGERVLAAAEAVDARSALRLFAGASPRRGDTVVLSEDPARDAGALARARVLRTSIRGEQVFAASPHERQ
jgi:predicted amidohydrolase YtcJ